MERKAQQGNKEQSICARLDPGQGKRIFDVLYALAAFPSHPSPLPCPLYPPPLRLPRLPCMVIILHLIFHSWKLGISRCLSAVCYNTTFFDELPTSFYIHALTSTKSRSRGLDRTTVQPLGRISTIHPQTWHRLLLQLPHRFINRGRNPSI